MTATEDMSNRYKKDPFSLDNYPKSYASTKSGDYRLKDYPSLDDNQLEGLTNDLFSFCVDYADNAKPRAEYRGYQYLASGWEWSVFKKMKIP